MVHLGAGELALLGGAGLLAGGVNAVAGGGSLISFPALLAVGYPSVPANVTNNVALLPGYLGGTLAYRAELAGAGPRARPPRAAGAGGAGAPPPAGSARRARWAGWPARCSSTSARRASSRRSSPS